MVLDGGLRLYLCHGNQETGTKDLVLGEWECLVCGRKYDRNIKNILTEGLREIA